MHARLRIDLLDMEPHGILGNDERLRDKAGRAAPREILEYLALSLSQPVGLSRTLYRIVLDMPGLGTRLPAPAGSAALPLIANPFGAKSLLRRFPTREG